MTPWITYLAAERDAHLRAQGHTEHDVREITAREIRTAIRDAERGDAGAREWIESPAWDVACALLGRGEVADRYRRVVLAGLGEQRVDTGALLRDGARLLALWRESGCSDRATARAVGCNIHTLQKWRRRAEEAEALAEAA